MVTAQGDISEAYVGTNRTVMQRIKDAHEGRSGGGVRDRKPTVHGRSGAAQGSGDGTRVAFNIAHGLGRVPVDFEVQGKNTASRATFTPTADATNITVTYAAAPTTGTNNLQWSWTATV